VRILILHSRYLSGPASGENRVVDDEAKLLSDAGHDVKVWQPFVRRGGAGLVKTGMEAVWSREAAATVRRSIRDMRPDIVHCHNLMPRLSPAVIRAAHAEGQTVVVTLHNYRSMCLPATFLRDGRICEDCLGHQPWRGVVHRCYRGSALASASLATSLIVHRSLDTFDIPALFLAVSPFVKEKHVEAGYPTHRIRVKSNFSWAAPRRVDPGKHFLFLGRLSEEKGLATLFEAWREIPARLLIVGDGPQRERLRALAPDTVEFRKTVPPSEVPALLREARALLLPSICYEAQPRVILEAYASGVPVIASNLGGLPDLIADGVTGFLLPPGEAESWKEGIARLLQDATSKELGDGALQMWHDRFSPDRGLMNLEAAYTAAVAEG
jgi:glycosyltransferase involved in cell wall biosynthesis